MNFIRSGTNDKREDRPRLFYPIFVSDDNKIRIPHIKWDGEKQEYNLLEKVKRGETIVYPIVSKDRNIVEKKWQRGHVRVKNELAEYRIRRDVNGEIKIDFKTRMDENSLPTTWWDKSRYASSNYGAAEIKNLFGKKIFDFAKSMRLVEDSLRSIGLGKKSTVALDFFAGSGTTAHAVINLNRQDDGLRKYVLVEMGQYFNTALKPRIQKAVYSEDWKDGKPVSRKGSSHAFKYIKLESYEDTLNNLELKRTEKQSQALLGAESFQEDYLLSYMLDIESKDSLLDLKIFETPFDYQLEIASSTVGETTPTKIDLVETFNYLIGLQIHTVRKVDSVVLVEGQTQQSKRVLVIWRNINELDNDKLNAFFTEHFTNRQKDFDTIYVNGDNTLANIRPKSATWKVHLIEEEFQYKMFEK